MANDLFRKIYASYHRSKPELDKFSEFMASRPDKLEEIRRHIRWAGFYDLTHLDFLGLSVVVFGWQDLVSECAKQANPTEAFIKWFDAAIEDEEPDDSLPIENHEDRVFAGIILSVCQVAFASIHSYQWHGKDIHTLLAESMGSNQWGKSMESESMPLS